MFRSPPVDKCSYLVLSLVIFLPFGVSLAGEAVPLSEHPRPDFEREDWLNLNGHWSFRFDTENTGEKEAWHEGAVDFPDRILVPFSWGSTLSGVEDRGDIGWYKREILIPDSWKDKRIYLVVGACDWHTSAWLDGRKLGDHRGGYTPFEFEMTSQSRPGQKHTLVLRVDDRSRSFKLEGKQDDEPEQT